MDRKMDRKMDSEEVCVGRTPDRGHFSSLTFNRCARGYTLSARGDYTRGDMAGPHFAFDKIEDLAAWLVEQYGPPPKPLTAKRNTRSGRRPAKRGRR